MAAANARDQAKQEREREAARGRERAAAVTRALESRLIGLRTLLRGVLDEDPYLPFDSFKEPLSVTEYRPPPRLSTPVPEPNWESFLPAPLTGWSVLSPGRRREYDAALAKGQDDYAQALAAHDEDERLRKENLARDQAAHDRAVDHERERVARQHRAVDQLAGDFAAGKRAAVAAYFREVLAVQRYPSDFPTGVQASYYPTGRQLRVRVDLPLLAAIPEFVSAEYQPIKKELRHKKLSPTDRKKLYQLVVAQMALRTVRSVFAADRSGMVDDVVCDGYVDTVNTATGQDVRWCLVSVQVPRDEFAVLVLDAEQFDPVECLGYLHAKVSQTPEKYQPVQPVLDYPWDDLPYAAETDATADLDQAQNLVGMNGYEFERLVLRLFKAIPEFDEVRPTQERRDGGIDLVAVNKTPFVGGRVAIQAKCYAPHRKIGVPAVREIIGSVTQREFTKGIIITTSGFTPAAREEAERLGVELYDGERLLWLLRHHLHREYTIVDTERRRAPFKSPPAG
ncbi:restriction endonuclease [Frankia sp. AgB1.9]|uniref:restriction endonuclease n=1 Tax=unclassified Frankia TaxID=2632575 RepID=UPI0019331ED2|nr:MULTISPECIES: restriction endonuclease [unclassified Frankia]MBL7487972.1 restriction endonuclease [Frankia sp. AgW1.1]MBL7550415.1 restriction endonuclease [Frankia sp. AgB1.9]MBL7620885.1 restriction endonuclease [Frankia sp. AgB1.8]